jgi:hypothetical protein
MTGSNLGGSDRATMSMDRLTSLRPQMPFQEPDRLPASWRSCPRPSKVVAAARCARWRCTPRGFEYDRRPECPESPPSCSESCGIVWAPRPFDSVLYGTYGGPSRLLCGRCFNLEVARRGGLVDFEHIEIEPLTMSDVRGREHVFQFRTHLFAAGVTIDAIELTEDQSEGYCFKVIGHEEGDPLELLARLITKMRRGLANSHLEAGAHGLQVSDRGIVRARIECDPEDETDMPVVVIDGRNIFWDEFGRMVATYMGFHFKLELHDLSDEI